MDGTRASSMHSTPDPTDDTHGLARSGSNDSETVPPMRTGSSGQDANRSPRRRQIHQLIDVFVT